MLYEISDSPYRYCADLKLKPCWEIPSIISWLDRTDHRMWRDHRYNRLHVEFASERDRKHFMSLCYLADKVL